MLVTNCPSSETLTLVRPAVEPKRSRMSGFAVWFSAAVLALVVPLAVVLGAVFVSSWGIPLPMYVAVP
jgi:hypothetical protein